MSTLRVTLAQSLPAIHVEWPEVNKDGKALAVSEANARTLLQVLGKELSFNAFTSEVEINHHGALARLTNAHAEALWAAAHHYGFASKFTDLVRLLSVTAHRRTHHPVLDHLQALKWDGQSRLNTWMSTYLGAEDTPLTQAISR